VSDAWRQAADPTLLAGLERWNTIVRPFQSKIRTALREPRLLLERSGWRARCDFEIAEREIPFELTQDLSERCPQAKLRDLFRPVMNVGWHEREQLVEPTDVAGANAIADAKAAQVMPRLPPFESLTKVFREQQTRRRDWLAERWLPHRPDDAPRVYTPWGTGFAED
jgi:hypothetical protein